MRLNPLLAPLLGLLPLCAAAPARGQTIDPRFFVNTPVGMNFVLGGYAYGWGSVSFDPTVPIDNAKVTFHGPLAGYSRSLDFWGLSGKANVGSAFICLDGSGEVRGVPESRNVCGLSDLSAAVAVNFLGAPALSLKEFPHYRQGLLLGASFGVTAPIGQYDPTKLINVGTNRWSFRPQLGISQALGRLTLEFVAWASFYTANNNFFNGRVREQAPLYSGQLNVIYTFRSGIWGSVGGTWYGGGRITTDGVPNPEFQENWRLGGTLVFPVNRRNALRVFGATGLYARTGGNFNALGVTWLYWWGGRKAPLKSPAPAPAGPATR